MPWATNHKLRFRWDTFNVTNTPKLRRAVPGRVSRIARRLRPLLQHHRDLRRRRGAVHAVCAEVRVLRRSTGRSGLIGSSGSTGRAGRSVVVDPSDLSDPIGPARPVRPARPIDLLYRTPPISFLIQGTITKRTTEAAPSVTAATVPKSVAMGIAPEEAGRPAGDLVAGGVREEEHAHHQADDADGRELRHDAQARPGSGTARRLR